MSLASLPPELLLKILDDVGADAFRKDVGRLTISKNWYQFALPVLFRRLELSITALLLLASSPAREKAAAMIQRYTVAVVLSLAILDFEDPAGTWLAKTFAENGDYVEMPPEDWLVTVFAERVIRCMAGLPNSISWLASVMESASQVRHVSLVAKLEVFVSGLDTAIARQMDIHPSDPQLVGPNNYLPAPTVGKLLSASHGNLTTLDIDTTGTEFTDSHTPSGGQHMCSTINALLPTLRRLRCRMRGVCNALLKPPTEGKMRLEEVVVNLTLSSTDWDGQAGLSTSLQYSDGCWPSDQQSEQQSITQWRTGMERQARRLALRLDKPKMVRVLYHRMRGPAILAYDALAERRVRLAENAPWDAEGEALGEEDGSDDSETDGSSNGGTGDDSDDE